ncbi:cytochrome c maturation protein CcmE [Prosthecomicrobium pneumaticum]|uniref:Cytochrome c-type biogenesis protein CcmE n=1 Tax=Prosthecomicrobium pneumaticum TaxID=81895 RepID=A0A7W9L392_9HYPH|nr:cytochrome c maturation protein CcmE [Prosthecomicrobium pneumaticum]MBB5754328.1 cytochrome c-type biogenesis protein CcmE [Prosthecomicrobium pneumaticum]
MTRKGRRLTLIGLAGVVLCAAVGLTLYALSDGISFFATPSEIAANPPPPERRLRLGGLVETGSVEKEPGGLVRFAVTDGKARVPVAFTGLLPDLFREGQGVVAEGRVGADGVFAADDVLAKHDETYMPKEVVDALKASGEWRPEAGAAPVATQ